jgi:hypothetical protein
MALALLAADGGQQVSDVLVQGELIVRASSRRPGTERV